MEKYSFSFAVMGCPGKMIFYAPSPERAAHVHAIIMKKLVAYDQYYTNYSPHSFTAEINRQAGSMTGIEVDEETAGLLDYAQFCYKLSDGLFDITSGPLHRIWVFESNTPAIPSQHQIDEILDHVGWDKVIWQKPRLVLPLPLMNIDFGGVVKEYAVDSAVGLFRELGVEHGFVDLGGDIRIVGPHLTGDPWIIGVENPQNPADEVGYFQVYQGAVTTSGNYARSMVVDGVRYCHILNPKTGYPVQGVASVSVQAELCLVAGSLTTISFLKGQEGLSWLKEQGVPFVFIDDQFQRFVG